MYVFYDITQIVDYFLTQKENLADTIYLTV